MEKGRWGTAAGPNARELDSCMCVSGFRFSQCVPAVPLYQLMLYSFTNYDIFHAPEFGGLIISLVYKGQGSLEFNHSY